MLSEAIYCRFYLWSRSLQPIADAAKDHRCVGTLLYFEAQPRRAHCFDQDFLPLAIKVGCEDGRGPGTEKWRNFWRGARVPGKGRPHQGYVRCARACRDSGRDRIRNCHRSSTPDRNARSAPLPPYRSKPPSHPASSSRTWSSPRGHSARMCCNSSSRGVHCDDPRARWALGLVGAGWPVRRCDAVVRCRAHCLTPGLVDRLHNFCIALRRWRAPCTMPARQRALACGSRRSSVSMLASCRYSARRQARTTDGPAQSSRSLLRCVARCRSRAETPRRASPSRRGAEMMRGT